MAVEQLYIDNTLIPTEKGVNPSITYQIADVQQPDKRKTTYSKTITIPNSKIASRVFSQAFEINLVDNSFNPTLKTDMYLLIDGLENMRGYVQLKAINVTDNNDISYSVVLFGELGNLFSDIKGKNLDDIDLSEYDHPLVEEAQRLSWDTSILQNGGLVPFELGKGYVYPLIDYGYTSDGLNYRVDELGCAIYVKEYWDRIFTENGYTYSSGFLNTDAFKGLIIPSSPDSYSLSAFQIANREFSANTPRFNGSGTTTDTIIPKEGLSGARLIEFTNEISDPNNLWVANNRYIVQETGTYTVTVTLDLGVTMTPTNMVSSISPTSEVRGNLYFYNNFSPIDSTPFYISPLGNAVGARTTDLTPTNPDADYRQSPWTAGLVPPLPRVQEPPNRYTLTYTGILNAGDDLRVYYDAGHYKTPGNLNYFTGGSNGTAQLVCEVGVVFNKALNSNIGVGNTLNINSTIPKNIKQSDFLISIINMYNLYVEADRFNKNNLIIEPYDSYYREDGVIDWSEKHDISKPTVIKPVSQAKNLNYIFKYKDDKDYYNELCSSSWGVSYGEREVNSVNDFLKGDAKTELIFSPTPIVGNPNSPIVVPTIIGNDDLGQATQTKHNIRILYYGGLKGEPNGNPLITPWKHYDPLINFAWNRYYYPYAGHFDDPFNPTLDINFGLVNELYYDSTAGAISVTTNNLYNTYHSKLVNNILDVNGKTFTGYFLLNALDIYGVNFRRLFYHNNAYWRLLKIENYNPNSSDTVKCEFLKVNEDYRASGPLIIVVGGDRRRILYTSNSVDETEETPVLGNNFGNQKDGNSFNKKTTTIKGANNYVNKLTENIDIQGDNNKVFSNTKNISLINSNGNTIESGLENVTLINTNDLTITESNVTYMNGVLQSKSIKYINSYTIASEDVEMYLLDDCVLGLPDQTINGNEWIVKNIASLDSSVSNRTKLIDAKPKIDLLNKWEAVTIKFDEVLDTYRVVSSYRENSDHHSGWNEIIATNTVTIDEKKQMINYDGLAIDGDLNIIGDLILK